MNVKEACKAFIGQKYNALESGVKEVQPDHIINNILERGSTDFTQSYAYGVRTNIHPSDKAVLYCHHYYFDMHFSSSYAVFDACFKKVFGRCFKPTDFDQALFVDFGCGPGTSGLAFAEWKGDANFYYIGIDRAGPMLKMAEDLFRRIGMPESNFFIRKGSDFLNALNFDKTYPHWLDSPVVLLNFCFSLAPATFKGNTSGMLRLCNSLSSLLGRFKSAEAYVVYQNPVHHSEKNFHEHWEILKRQLLNSTLFCRPVNYGRENSVHCEILHVKDS